MKKRIVFVEDIEAVMKRAPADMKVHFYRLLERSHEREVIMRRRRRPRNSRVLRKKERRVEDSAPVPAHQAAGDRPRYLNQPAENHQAMKYLPGSRLLHPVARREILQELSHYIARGRALPLEVADRLAGRFDCSRSLIYAMRKRHELELQGRVKQPGGLLIMGPIRKEKEKIG